MRQGKAGRLAPPYLYLQLATLKQRGKKAARGPGQAPSGIVSHRLVPLFYPQYVAQMVIMVATLKIPIERHNLETGRTEKVRLWTVADWLNDAVEAAASDGVTFSVPVTPTRSGTATPCTCCTPVFR